MNFSDECKEKLRIWIATGTWHTTHPLDMDRFYVFVSQYEKDHGLTIPDEGILQDTISSMAEIDTQNEHLSNIIMERISLMGDILDFLEVRSKV